MLNVSKKIYYRQEHFCWLLLCWWGLVQGGPLRLKVLFPIWSSVACVIQLDVMLFCFLWSGYTNWSEMAKLVSCQPPNNHQLGLLDETSLEQSMWYALKRILSFLMIQSPELHPAPPSKKKKETKSFNAFWRHTYASSTEATWTLLKSSFLTYLMALCQKATPLSLNTRQIFQNNLILRRHVWEVIHLLPWKYWIQSIVQCERPSTSPALAALGWKLSCQFSPSAFKTICRTSCFPATLACLLARIPLWKTFLLEILW